MDPVVIDYDLCNEDGICAAVCPRKLIAIEESRPVTVAKIAELCIRCGHCLAVCPTGAVAVDGVSADACARIAKKHWPNDVQLDHLMRSRQSIRVYKDKGVDRDILAQIFDTCRYAPSGSNLQPVNWIVVDQQEKIRALAQLAIDWMKQVIDSQHELATKLPLSSVVQAWQNGEDRIFRGAPVVLITHAPRVGSLPLESCVIAMTYFDLMAATKGLGSCWVGFLMLAAAHHPPIRQALGIPDEHLLYGAMVVGYPKYAYKRIPARKPPQVAWL